MKKFKQFMNWLKLTSDGLKAWEIVMDLQNEYNYIQDTIFPDRMQFANGVFKSKPTEFIEPKNWGIYDPCTVTIFRNALEDHVWNDGIINIGTDEDVKTFSCPHFQENAPCSNTKCRYHKQNNDYYVKLPQQIKHATAVHEKIVAQRKAAWKQLIHSK